MKRRIQRQVPWSERVRERRPRPPVAPASLPPIAQRYLATPRVLVLIISLLASLSPANTRINLRTVVRAPANAPLTLSQIAHLTGDDADSLADLVILETLDPTTATANGWINLDIQRLREILQQHNLRLSTLELRGGSCAILPTTPTNTSHPTLAPAELPAPARAQPTTLLHDLAASAIATKLAVAPTDLRLTFDDRDRDFLHAPTRGRTYNVKPAGVSDRMSIAITVYQGDRIADSRTIRVDVLIRRQSLIANREIRRGETIAATDAAPKVQWLPPTISPANRTDTIGRVATRTIAPNRVIESHMVEPPIVVKRGDMVTIHCLSGSILIEIQRMRARRDAREGETIEFESTDGTRKRLHARADAPGRAVIVAANAISPGGGA